MNEDGVANQSGYETDIATTSNDTDYSSFYKKQNELLKNGKLLLGPLDSGLPVTFSGSVRNKFTPALRSKFKQLAYEYYKEFGTKLQVNDGFREKGDSHYSSSSLHISGNAIDVHGPTKEKAKWIADHAYYLGMNAAIGKQNNYFIHCDVGPHRTFAYTVAKGYKYCDVYKGPNEIWKG
jgi:hypothetical protein